MSTQVASSAANRERVTELSPGDQLGRYQLLLSIATGGMGRVWVARQTGQRGLRKLVAVKTALEEYARNPEFERLFMDEARVACAVEHPNVCRVLEVGDEDGVLFLAMEWLGGGSLRELLSACPERRLDPRIASRMISQACAGLHAAHELRDESGTLLGVIHRDVSPHNLLLSVDGHVKLADFGVVRSRNQLHEKTNTGDFKGKASYMAPEQLASRSYDRRSDVFALGCVLYEAIVGAKAFEGDALTALYRIIEGQFTRPRDALGACDEELEKIILRAMAKQPEDRFATADDMRLALERWLASTGEPCTESDVASAVKNVLGGAIERRAAKIRAAEAAVAAGASTGTSAGGGTSDSESSVARAKDQHDAVPVRAGSPVALRPSKNRATLGAARDVESTITASAPQLQFGKYVPIAELGQGGMADVYLSATTGPAGFTKLLVIKKLRAALADDPEFVSMLLDEGRIAARLNHANVVQTYEIGSVAGEYFIAMEYLEGQPLHRIIRRAEEEAAYDVHLQYVILIDVLAGLHHAHELRDYDGTPLSVVHRDVSPHNIFVTYDGQVKVVDFGIAKAAGRISTATREGILKGKVRYMAPEQVLGTEVDRRADIFSVGVLLWTLATGRRMWDGLDEVTILTRLISHDIPSSPQSVCPGVPDEIDRICRRALAFDAANRYATALEMQSDIEAFLTKAGRRSSVRDVGALVARLFAADRAATRAAIERKLVDIQSTPDASIEPLPTIAELTMPKRSPSKPDASHVPDAPRSVPGAGRSRAGEDSEPSKALEATGITVITSTGMQRPSSTKKASVGLAAGALLLLGAGLIGAFAIGRNSPNVTGTEPVASSLTPEALASHQASPSAEPPALLGSSPPGSSLPLIAPTRVPHAVAAPPPRASVVASPSVAKSSAPATSVKLPDPLPKETDDGLSTRH